MKKIKTLLLILIVLFSFSSIFVLGDSCSSIPSDGIISLKYPTDASAEFLAKGWPNRGAIWIPREACGQSVTLVIALHGWRSFSSDANVYIGSNSDKGFDEIAKSYISNGKIDPIVIAAPMHDKGPDSDVFGSQYYDVNTHINMVQSKLSEFGITIKDVVLTGHSNALCADGLKNAVAGVLRSGLPLKLVAMFDGTCGSVNYADKILNQLEMENTRVVHIYQLDVSAIGNTAAGLSVRGQNPMDLSGINSYFIQAKKNSNSKWYDLVFNPGTNTPSCSGFNLPCSQSFSSLHGAIPSFGFQYILESLFPPKTSSSSVAAQGASANAVIQSPINTLLSSPTTPSTINTGSVSGGIDEAWILFGQALGLSHAVNNEIWNGQAWTKINVAATSVPNSANYNINTPNAGTASTTCIDEANKLVKAAIAMKDWKKGDYGVDGSPCPTGSGACCGSYVWHVFDEARNNYDLTSVTWDLTSCQGKGKILYNKCWDPEWIKPPALVYKKGEGDLNSFKFLPGDIIKYEYRCYTPDTHTNIIGNPVNIVGGNIDYQLIDIACARQGKSVCDYSWNNYFSTKTFGSCSQTIADAITRVFRPIPACRTQFNLT